MAARIALRYRAGLRAALSALLAGRLVHCVAKNLSLLTQTMHLGGGNAVAMQPAGRLLLQTLHGPCQTGSDKVAYASTSTRSRIVCGTESSAGDSAKPGIR